MITWSKNYLQMKLSGAGRYKGETCGHITVAGLSERFKLRFECLNKKKSKL